jgi:predicted metalloprotease
MRWERGHVSPDVIDQRAAGGAGGAGLIWILFAILRSRFGIVGVLIALGLFVLMGGLRGMLGAAEPERAGNTAADPRQLQASSDEQVQFISFVLDDAQNTWKRLFAERGEQYRNAKLLLFNQRTSSACGYGSAATGPFYCPADERVYIDLGFYRELADRFGAPGDFAQAYVVAHEVGHHVQNLLGISDRVHRSSPRAAQGATGLSVRLELQADCFAGIWAHATERRELLEKGDVEEGLGAASAIGDDRLQKRASGTVEPESWTHGSSEQRVRWFKRGYEQGSMDACDTFAAGTL